MASGTTPIEGAKIIDATFSNSYVNGHFYYTVVGNVVTFSATYTFTAAVSSNLAIAVSAPIPKTAVRVLDFDTSASLDTASDRGFLIRSSGNDNKFNIFGAHASGKTYHASGSYLR